VVGIPAEAREAARAAARREGLSVGEWLTRRIARRLTDEPIDDAGAHDVHANVVRLAQSASAAQANNPDHVESASEPRGKGSDDDSAPEIEQKFSVLKAALRWQAEAFDRLAEQAGRLAERVASLEQNAARHNVRQALEALHLGLSRLADDAARAADQSAAQFAGLHENLDVLASTLERLQQRIDETAVELNGRASELAGRIQGVEQTAGAAAASLEHVVAEIEALRASQQSNERALERHASAISLLQEQLDRGAAFISSIEETVAKHSARIDDLAAKIEPPSAKTEFDQRVQSIEETVSNVVSRIEGAEITYAGQGAYLERMLHDLALRVDRGEPHGSQTAEVPDRPVSAAAESPELESPAAPEIVIADPAPELPPEPVPAVSSSPEPTAADQARHLSPPSPPESPREQRVAPQMGQARDSPPAAGDTFLDAARRSARAAAIGTAASSADMRGSSWRFPERDETERRRGRSRYLIAGIFVSVVVLAAIAAIVLNRRAESPVRGSSQIVAQHVSKLPGERGRSNDGDRRAAQHRLTQSTATGATAPHPQQTPLASILKFAQAGNAKAELLLGLCYLEGEGIAANEAEAARWLARAAQQNEAVAQYRLATLYERGRGVPADAKLAARWYEQAAAEGNIKSMHNLAVAYAQGSGEPKDYAKAAMWFRKAAEFGVADSQFNLAVLYERGMGVKQNLAEAYKWYSIAAAHGDAESKTRIAILVTQLSPNDRMAVERMAATFRPQAPDPAANAVPALD